MTDQVLPLNENILEEDEDQGEMDTIFFLSLFVYTIYLCCIDILFPEAKDKEAIGTLNLILSNLWAFYPIMQAQGLWLKTLLSLTCYYSILWHWSRHFYLPGDSFSYGRRDAIFSILTIVSYCLSWLPKLATKIPSNQEEKRSCWYKNCLGRPKKTSEWRCRWTSNLVINIGISLISGAILYLNFGEDNDVMVQISICWISICIALISAMYQLMKGEMKIGMKYRNIFAFWAILGIVFGCISFVHKLKSDDKDANSNFDHSVWHVYVMSCAYSFSRASEYLEIY
jgi:hypothetical protein